MREQRVNESRAELSTFGQTSDLGEQIYFPLQSLFGEDCVVCRAEEDCQGECMSPIFPF